MARQNSDFRAGVEEAAKWLRSRPGDRRFVSDDVVRHIADEMVRAIGDDPEGTEARTVAQIVQYLREQELMADDDVASIALRGAAEDIARGDWKLK